MEKEIIFRVYPDQNVWDYILKGKFPEITFDQKIDRPFKIEFVYSKTTLDEFERIQNQEQRNEFLGLLKNRDAKYIEINYETEDANFVDCDPFKQYSIHIQNKDIAISTINAFQDFSFKMLSGDKTRSVEDIWNTIFGNMTDLFKSSISKIEDKLDDKMKENIAKSLSYFNELPKYISEMFSASIPSINQSPLKSLKEALPYDLSEINNLETENAVRTIWDKTKRFYGVDDNGNESVENKFEQLFNSNNKFAKPWKMLEKINAVYLFLNMSGYWQDESLEKKRKFIPSINDAGHAFCAAYSHLFITRDMRFAKKLKAVYAYFNIGTQVFHYDENVL